MPDLERNPLQRFMFSTSVPNAAVSPFGVIFGTAVLRVSKVAWIALVNVARGSKAIAYPNGQ